MSAERFDHFMKLHQELLDCYAETKILEYKNFNGLKQRELCLTHRAQIAELLTSQKLKAADFFEAAKKQQ